MKECELGCRELYEDGKCDNCPSDESGDRRQDAANDHGSKWSEDLANQITLLFMQKGRIDGTKSFDSAVREVREILERNAVSARSADALLPCPFCGGTKELIVSVVDDCYYVTCGECSTQGPTGSNVDCILRAVKDAVGKWNRRAGRAGGGGVPVASGQPGAGCRADPADAALA